MNDSTEPDRATAAYHRRAGRSRRAGAGAARQRGRVDGAGHRCCTSPATTGASSSSSRRCRSSRPSARHHVSRLGHGAVRPRRPRLRHRRPPHRGAGQAGADDAQAPDHRADDRQRDRAAGAAARSFIASAPSADGAGPAHRLARLIAAASPSSATRARAPSWSRASTPCAAASSTSIRRGRSSPRAARLLRRHAGDDQSLRRDDAAHHQAGAEAAR